MRVRVTRWGIAFAAAACVLVSAPAADALTITRFTAYATAANIHYTVGFCERSASQVHEHFAFHALDRPSGTFTDDVSYTVPHAGCWTGRGHFPNHYLGGLWELDLTLDDSHGVLLHASTRVFISGP